MKIRVLKDCRWAYPEPSLPHVSFSEGDTPDNLPIEMAESMIRQGFAEEYKYGSEVREENDDVYNKGRKKK